MYVMLKQKFIEILYRRRPNLDDQFYLPQRENRFRRNRELLLANQHRRDQTFFSPQPPRDLHETRIAAGGKYLKNV